MNTPLTDLSHTLLANSRRWFPEVTKAGLTNEIIHMTLGIAGEVGEVAEHIKKAHRYGPDAAWTLDPMAIGFELADVLTYILNLAALLDLNMDEMLGEKQAVCEARWGKT